MKPRKKTLPKKLQIEEEKEKKFSELFDKAEKGNTQAMVRMLMESDRGYKLSEKDFSDIFGNPQEGL